MPIWVALRESRIELNVNHLGRGKSMTTLWNRAKTWNSIPFGPVSILFRLARRTRVTSNFLRRGRKRLQAMPIEAIAQVEPIQELHLKDKEPPVALILGVGPGLGYALADTLAAAGFHVAMASRNAKRLDPIAENLRKTFGGKHHAYGCDATMEKSVQNLFKIVAEDMGSPELVVYAVQGFDPGKALNVEVCAFESSWRQNCLGAFITAREAGRRMTALGKGSIVLVGSTSGMIGRADHLCLAVGKFGMRALSQVMARELWPQGIHVVHCVIDADILESEQEPANFPQSNPIDIAAFILSLHQQPRSAWTSEADLRPYNERFWEHC